ncbi:MULTISPECIES: hypothetical protein [Clostridium]|uniref:hypothetical protein n=1 Tax=Clostridium TaxID=1485 RepID=UPI0022594BD9|nr:MULTISPECIES: hypothetical protein [Clostridium]UZT07754.1 hypothetical protein ONV75_07790 [Clostridium sp. LQ25]
MKIFIAGPRTVSVLNISVRERVKNIINNNFTILVGDANGVDKAVQKFCNEANYGNVNIFASNGRARNNIGDWQVINVEVPVSKKGFEFYAAKDLEMAKSADYGLMIWNGKSRGTLNNMVNLCMMEKEVLVYFIPHKKFYKMKSIADVKWIVDKCDLEVKELLNECLSKNAQIKLDI